MVVHKQNGDDGIHFLCSVCVIYTDVVAGVLLSRQLDWRPEKQGDARKRHEKVVIIQNMFHPSDFEVSTQTHTHGTFRQ